MEEGELKQAFGRRVGDLRRKSGLSQSDLANKINELRGQTLKVSSGKQTIANIESGAKGASLNMVALLAMALGVPISYLFHFVDDDTTERKRLLDAISESDDKTVAVPDPVAIGSTIV